ncbi:MAG: LysR family transcriptional regulator [Candidatus Binatus sp.]
MADIDLNLLTAFDALLAEGSVVGAARRMGLSASAMSRTLARLRAATGDPLLVRAGRGLVPTPHATELRERVRDVAHDAQAVLRPAVAALDLAELKRSFTIRSNEGFLEGFAPQLVAAVTAAAPNVSLRFAPKPDKDVQALREGLVDLEIGVLGKSGPEVRVQTLFRDHFVCAVRAAHPLLARGKVTPERYAACGHVVASRRGHASGPVDEALAALGLSRTVVVVVPSFRAALAVAGVSDLVALVTSSFFNATQGHQAKSGLALRSFPLPVRTEAITVSQMWHPRLDADPAHRWLRGLVLATCRELPRNQRRNP